MIVLMTSKIEQELTNYNTHYQQNGYHPLVLFDGMTGDFIKAELRKGSDYTSTGIGAFIKPVITFYKKYNLKKLMFRADSGFATPELYKLCEQNQVSYVIRLKDNKKLYEAVKDIEAKFYECNKLCLYYEFQYKANSWDKPRRVICKFEKKTDELLVSKTFIVTNDLEMTAKQVVAFYAQRGTMESYIKESKLGFGLTNLSSHFFYTNYYHMYVKLLAYNLNNFFRTMILPLKERSYQMETLRSKLIKIAGKIVKSGRQTTIKLSGAYPFKNLFNNIYIMIINLKVRIGFKLRKT
jgi:Transposase DDE domain group 1